MTDTTAVDPSDAPSSPQPGSVTAFLRRRVALARDAEPEPPTPAGLGFWLGLAVGAPILVYGIVGLIEHLPGVQLTSWLRFFVGGAVVHDLVVGPLVCLVGWAVVRLVPPVATAPVTGALIASGVTALVAWPFVRGYGITEGEPSFLSRDYTTSLVVCVAIYWTVAVVVVAVRARRRR